MAAAKNEKVAFSANWTKGADTGRPCPGEVVPAPLSTTSSTPGGQRHFNSGMPLGFRLVDSSIEEVLCVDAGAPHVLADPGEPFHADHLGLDDHHRIHTSLRVDLTIANYLWPIEPPS